MTLKVFVTGTDTGVGKTAVSCALLDLAKSQGFTTAALKPVAAGCEEIDGEWKNDDAVQLQERCTETLSYEEINPVALKQAIAPHLAAHFENKNVTVDRLSGISQNVFMKKADLTVIEGAGGWHVPINHREFMSHYVKQMNLPVLLVVGVRLGCLNHSLLTVQAILNQQLPLVGWVANCIDEQMPAQNENIQTLEQLIPAPCLGVIPFSQKPEKVMQENIRFDLLERQLKAV